jgi:hypothetical protein
MRNQDQSVVSPNCENGILHEKGVIEAEVFKLEMAGQNDRYLQHPIRNSGFRSQDAHSHRDLKRNTITKAKTRSNANFLYS